eukprot:GHVT01025994.1.p2 GENE.GHVT01025994.1~~GHVT01025994.1.p2  ORF type:complete len:157 (-),score=11.36 GHVT01025994.1:642-1112(-)
MVGGQQRDAAASSGQHTQPTRRRRTSSKKVETRSPLRNSSHAVPDAEAFAIGQQLDQSRRDRAACFLWSTSFRFATIFSVPPSSSMLKFEKNIYPGGSHWFVQKYSQHLQTRPRSCFVEFTASRDERSLGIFGLGCLCLLASLYRCTVPVFGGVRS